MTDEELGKLQQQVDTLIAEQDKLKTKIADQEALINKGRGAFYILAVVGSIVTLLLNFYPGG